MNILLVHMTEPCKDVLTYVSKVKSEKCQIKYVFLFWFRFLCEPNNTFFGCIKFGNMNRGNNNNNDDPNVGAVVATVAIGAAAVYGAFKLFGSMFDSNEPGQSNSVRIQGRPHQQLSLDSSMDRPQIYSFRRNQEIHLVNTVKECRYSMRELKSYVRNNKTFFIFII